MAPLVIVLSMREGIEERIMMIALGEILCEMWKKRKTKEGERLCVREIFCFVFRFLQSHAQFLKLLKRVEVRELCPGECLQDASIREARRQSKNAHMAVTLLPVHSISRHSHGSATARQLEPVKKGQRDSRAKTSASSSPETGLGAAASMRATKRIAPSEA